VGPDLRDLRIERGVPVVKVRSRSPVSALFGGTRTQKKRRDLGLNLRRRILCEGEDTGAHQQRKKPSGGSAVREHGAPARLSFGLPLAGDTATCAFPIARLVPSGGRAARAGTGVAIGPVKAEPRPPVPRERRSDHRARRASCRDKNAVWPNPDEL